MKGGQIDPLPLQKKLLLRSSALLELSCKFFLELENCDFLYLGFLDVI